MSTRDDIQAKAEELDRTLDGLAPAEQARVAIRSSNELAAILIRDCDAERADGLTEQFAALLNGVPMPTCIGAICSILATVISEISKGEGSRLVVVGAVSGILGNMLRTIDVIDEAARATKQ